MGLAIVSCAVLAFVVFETTKAQADFVGKESFEDTHAGGNIVLDEFSRLRILGPTTFASGVTLTGPFPQSLIGSTIGIEECALGCGFSLANNGAIVSAGDVPDGTAYFAVGDQSGIGRQDETRPLEFTFPEEMQFVSALVTGAYFAPRPHNLGRTITLTAFDVLGKEIVSTSIESVHKDHWSENRISITAPGISKIAFQGYVYALDDLRFSTVPEPTVISLILAGLYLTTARLRR